MCLFYGLSDLGKRHRKWDLLMEYERNNDSPPFCILDGEFYL